MGWFFLLFSTLSWGIAEIFYKKGNVANEKYSHLKTTFFVGIFMGIYATIILFTQGIDLKSFPLNFVYYLPVASCYILSMVCSYFGVRFIAESIADPIENSSGALVPILCAIFLKEKLEFNAIAGIIIIAIGIIAVSVLDKQSRDERRKQFGKRIAVWAIAMPFCYLILDTIGTFLDIYYIDDVANTILVNVTEANIEHTANCAYEFTFFLVAIAIFIFLKIKKVKIFSIDNNDNSESKQKTKWMQKLLSQKWKLLAALFEMAGQATYLFALSSGKGIAAVILGAGTVITSLILSRIFLKEKLTIYQYVSILFIVVGIIVLNV